MPCLPICKLLAVYIACAVCLPVSDSLPDYIMSFLEKIRCLCGSPVFLTFGSFFRFGAVYEREAPRTPAVYERDLSKSPLHTNVSGQKKEGLSALRNPIKLDFPMLFPCWFDVGSVLLWCCFLVESLLFPCWQNVVLLLVLPSKWHFCRMARYAFVVQTHLVRETLRP